MKTFVKTTLGCAVAVMISMIVGTNCRAQGLQLVNATTDYNFVGLSSSWPDSWFLFYLKVENLGINPVDCKVRIDKSGLANGHRAKFCFAKECYEESVLESIAPLGVSTIEPGTTDTTFVGDFRADETFASSTVTITFFSTTNQLISTQAEMHFNVQDPASSVQESELSQSMTAVPNPAQDLLRIGLSNPNHERRHLRIVDVQGKTVESMDFYADQLTFSTSSLVDGSYMAMIETADGQLAVRRFAVLH